MESKFRTRQWHRQGEQGDVPPLKPGKFAKDKKQPTPQPELRIHSVVNVKELSIMRCQDDINTEHNIKLIGRAAVARSVDKAPDSQWTNASSNPRGVMEYSNFRQIFSNFYSNFLKHFQNLFKLSRFSIKFLKFVQTLTNFSQNTVINLIYNTVYLNCF